MNMELNSATILFTLVYKQEETRVYSRPDEYCSLLSLISDHLTINGFGLCSGMGGCGTCIVEIKKKFISVNSIVLSCMTPVNEELTNAHILISGEYT
jgi:aerobic-type carbon monoxide dehydrogenase small subunit (CoxS/CutS family)